MTALHVIPALTGGAMRWLARSIVLCCVIPALTGGAMRRLGRCIVLCCVIPALTGGPMRRLARCIVLCCVIPALTGGPMRRLARCIVLFCVIPALTGGAMLAAQEASPYVPLQHWAMPYVEHLITTGVVADPTPLTRPLKRSDLARALQAADTTRLSRAARATVRRLLAEFTPRHPAPSYRIEGATGAAAATYAFRDPLELGRGTPARQDDNRAFASAGLEFQLRFGSLVAVTRPTVDTRTQYDPDWYASNDNATRFEEAYLSAQWRSGEAFFGILDRNWGPSSVQGLLLSGNPYSMDHLALSVGTSRVQIQAMVTQLDTRDSAGAAVNRYMNQHRLWIRPRGRWALAVWEGSVWSGVGRQIEPWYVNVATVGFFRQSSSGVNVNNFLGFDAERRANTTVFAQFMLDDIQVSRKTPEDLKPTSYAFTVGAKGRVRRASVGWQFFYTQVANLTYRNENNLQVPLYHLLGTGRNFADYDQATLKLSVLPRPSLLLEPELTLLRQGEGDPRLLHPLVPDYPSTATLFQGVVERTLRVALGGSWQLGGFQLSGNGGVHLIHNAGHMSGTSYTRWVGSLGVTYRISYENVLP